MSVRKARVDMVRPERSHPCWQLFFLPSCLVSCVCSGCSSGVGPGGVLGLGSCVESVSLSEVLGVVFVSAFVFADLMALLCFFCGSVIALWLGGSRLVCFCLLCMHRIIFNENAKLGS